jgi:hypothetical protein
MDMPPNIDDVTATEETSTEPASAAPSHGRRSITAVAVVALLVAALAVAGVVYLWFELDDVKTSSERQVSFLRSSISDLEYRVDSLESDVGDTFGFDSLSRRVEDLEDSVGSLSGYDSVEDRLSSIESDLGDLGFIVFDQGGQISDLTACVNDYMETVGDAGGGRYTYYFC